MLNNGTGSAHTHEAFQHLELTGTTTIQGDRHADSASTSSGNWEVIQFATPTAGAEPQPAWIPGKYGSALDFDGTDDYLSPGTPAALNTKFTSVMAWVNLDNPLDDTSHEIYNRQNSSNAGAVALRKRNTGNLYAFQIRLDGTESTARIITSDTAAGPGWHHVAGTYDGTTIKMYVDGVLQTGISAISGAIDIDTLNSIDLARHPQPTNYLGGKMDDVRIYDYARSTSQIIEDMNAGHPAPGSPIGSAVGHWKLDEGYGTAANDQTTNDNDLTLSTASWTNSGKFGKAWNGTGALWLSRADDADFDFSATEDLTASLWFKSDSASNPGAVEYLLNKANATTAGYAVYANTSGQICFGIDDDTTWNPDIASCTTTDYYDGTWHHAAAVRNTTADETRIYIDAVSRDSDSDTTTATLANSLSLYLGDRDATDNGDEFNGDLDEVKIFRSALTADQIKLLYNQSKATVFGAVSTDSSNNPSFSSTDSYCPPGQGSTCTAPVAEWTFNEGTGTSVNDSSGNAYTLTWNGTGSHWASGKIDKAGLFNDATADWLLGSTSLNLSGDFTIESWFKSTEAPANQQFLINKRRTSGNLEYTIRIENTDNKLNFIVWNTINGQFLTTEHPTAIAGDNTWHYFVGTVSGTTMTLYLDGVETAKSASTTGTRNGAHSDPFEIGGANSASLWNGHVDQVKIYNYARTPAQIAWDYNQGAPLAHWRFNECTGTTANDSSGNSYTGTIYPVTLGNTAVGTCSSGVSTEMWNNGTTGKRNASLDLDGTDDYIQVADTANLRFDASTQDFSIFAWVKRNTSGAAQYIISKEDADNDGYRLQFDSGNTVTCSVDTIDITSTSTITDTNWHSLGCVIDRDGNGQVYIDAKPDGSAVAISSEAMATTANIRLGTRAYTSTNYLDGQIDEVKIFNYALTAQQVRDLFNEGAVHFGN